jgi:5'-nucleotidase/UDP-sugar diphosphatase
VNLDGKKSTVRNVESNMGDLIADAVLWTAARDGAKIALVNGGGIRASVPAGDITMGQIMETLPFGNRLVQFDINGSDLTAALENGLSALDTDPEKSGGRFLQVSGIRFSADLSKPAGARITEIQIGTVASGFQAIDPAATYRVVTLDYMLSGGDGFTMFKNGRSVHGGDVPEEQAVIEYLKANPSVNQQVEARIALIK